MALNSQHLMETMKSVLILLTILAPIATLFSFIVIAVRRSNRPQNLSDYFIFSKNVDSPQYVTASVSYALQLAVTVYFVFWGFKYGIGVFWYVLFWWLGILLFKSAAKKLLPFAFGSETLHGFLKSKYSGRNIIRKLAAVSTILGLLGALLVEINFGTETFYSFLQSTSSNISDFYWIVIFILLVLFGFAYMVVGGYKASVITDQLQYPFSIVSMVYVISFIALLGASNGKSHESATILLILLLYISFVYYLRKRESHNNSIQESYPDNHLKHHKRFLIALFISFVFILIILIRTISLPAINKGIPIIGNYHLFSFKALFSQFSNWKDILVLLSFLVIDLCWQFVDMASWQRVQSLHLPKKDEKEAEKIVKKSIMLTMWESPLSWGLGILMGMGLHYSGLFTDVNQAESSLNVFVRNVVEMNFNLPLLKILSVFVMPFVLIGFISIMYSTVDGCLSVITYSAYSDIGGKDVNKNIDKKGLLNAQIIAGLFLLFGIVFIFITKYVFKFSPFLLLNLAYCSQLALFPVVIGALYRESGSIYLNSKLALWSIIFGWIGAYIVGSILATFSLDDLSNTIPVVSCFSLSVLTYLIGLSAIWYKHRKRK
jgi:hypothetical protein